MSFLEVTRFEEVQLTIDKIAISTAKAPTSLKNNHSYPPRLTVTTISIALVFHCSTSGLTETIIIV